MTSDHTIFFSIVAGVVACSAAYGWFSDKSAKIKEDEFNRNLRKQLEEKERAFLHAANARNQELSLREAYLGTLKIQFGSGYIKGRQWLAKFIAEADLALDESISYRLREKKRPAYRAAEEVAEARSERRAYKERVKNLEYQLISLKEYFPFIEDYEDVILDESISLLPGDSNVSALEESDAVLRFVSKADYDRLPPAERNQRALDSYLAGALGPAAIGRLYERYLGYLFEKDGWKVEYYGIVKGFEDLGRDLICTKGKETKIIQAKCWSSQKTIHEKHIFQLYGTTQLFLMDREANDLFVPSVTARFVTTTQLSPVARKAAKWLKIEIDERRPLDKKFPMIKCNINQGTMEKIYHLPFDQQYDRTKILPELGELYVSTTAEAEAKDFRRAFRFGGNSA